MLLRNTSGFSRRERRRTIPSQGRQYLASACLGFYRRPYRNHPAHIELHVDRIIAQAPRLALGVSVYRESLFAQTLYHELGHHIHRALQPEHCEPEDTANAWAERLRSAFFQQKYHCLTPEQRQRVLEVAAKLEQRRARQRHARPQA